MKVIKVDKDRKEMALEQFSGVGVEVGVADGNYGQFILAHNPKVTKLYGVDIYRPHKQYKDYTRKDTFDGMLNNAHRKLDYFGERHEFIFKYSMNAAYDFEDESLDFVYIDANHDYKHVLEDITEWSKKVKPGGVVSGDDYARLVGRGETYEVIRAVNDYAEANDIELLLYKAGHYPTNWLYIK